MVASDASSFIWDAVARAGAEAGEDGRLHFPGRAGTGFLDSELRRVFEILQPLRITKMPLDVPPPRKTRFGSRLELSHVHWVKPELVCEVAYLAWTADGLLRAVSYHGLRADKPANEVRRWRRSHARE
jgi:ATP-dependent DNA ligase